MYVGHNSSMEVEVEADLALARHDSVRSQLTSSSLA